MFDDLIQELASAPVPADAHNEYAGDDPNNRIRRSNLRRYLQQIHERQPTHMLVLEAPGYRGCRMTGVPVTSRKLLLQGVPELDMFGVHAGYQDTSDAGFEHIQGEQSATIVWGTLVQLGVVPLIWNTYPFHPHKPDQPLTNRKPRQPEIEQGAVFLQRIVQHFQPQTVIAVGNVAHGSLSTLGIVCAKVRHPAQGGKNDFVAGLTAVLRNA